MTIIATTALSTTSSTTTRTRIDDTLRLLDEVSAEVYVLPGGWFSAGDAAAGRLIARLESRLSSAVSERLLCFGVDARHAQPWSRDQLAVALTGDGITGLARKFHAAPVERNTLAAASDHLSTEAGRSRIITHAHHSFYLAVCYDCFGIRHRGLANPGVDAILTTVHGFYPPGTADSGATYFARHGIAGASKAWNIPAFASATFFNRPLPDRWPTGILWASDRLSTTKWTYNDNGIRPKGSRALELRSGQCRVDTYKL